MFSWRGRGDGVVVAEPLALLADVEGVFGAGEGGEVCEEVEENGCDEDGRIESMAGLL